MTNLLGIDVATRDARKLMRRLKRLKSTEGVEYGGAYWEDRNYSTVFIATTMNSTQLDDWLYRVKHGCDYVGTFERKFV